MSRFPRKAPTAGMSDRIAPELTGRSEARGGRNFPDSIPGRKSHADDIQRKSIPCLVSISDTITPGGVGGKWVYRVIITETPIPGITGDAVGV